MFSPAAPRSHSHGVEDVREQLMVLRFAAARTLPAEAASCPDVTSARLPCRAAVFGRTGYQEEDDKRLVGTQSQTRMRAAEGQRRPRR